MIRRFICRAVGHQWLLHIDLARGGGCLAECVRCGEPVVSKVRKVEWPDGRTWESREDA